VNLRLQTIRTKRSERNSSVSKNGALRSAISEFFPKELFSLSVIAFGVGEFGIGLLSV
jgi:hypothetical protein